MESPIYCKILYPPQLKKVMTASFTKVVTIFVFMIEPKAASPSSIEAKMNQIRALMARLQQEEGSLDDSLGLYNEATNLITQCQQMLVEAADCINNPSLSQP